jgi:cytoskeletal protein CcmA (bactofilin family)
MKDRKLEIDDNKITGFLDRETEIKGELNFKGSFRIDGNFKGNINSDSTLIIGENGKLEADLNVGHVIINGEIKGNIQAKEKVIINSSGRVIGTITTPILVVEEGAYLETNCQTVDKISRSMPEKSKERTP